MANLFRNPHGIVLEPVAHRYWDRNGLEWTSQSKFMKTFTHEFNPDQHLFSAQKQLKLAGNLNPSEEEIQYLGQQLKEQWGEKGKKSSDFGTKMHDAIQLYSETTQIAEGMEEHEYAINGINALFNEYASSNCEAIMWLRHKTQYGDIRICGTTDRGCMTKNRAGKVDYADYKTGKGYELDYHDPYKKFFTGPIDHLEHCNFNKYALQLSTYAFMGEMTLGLKPGKLFLVFIPAENTSAFYRVPVPYMKLEVKEMFKYYIHLHSKPCKK